MQQSQRRCWDKEASGTASVWALQETMLLTILPLLRAVQVSNRQHVPSSNKSKTDNYHAWSNPHLNLNISSESSWWLSWRLVRLCWRALSCMHALYALQHLFWLVRRPWRRRQWGRGEERTVHHLKDGKCCWDWSRVVKRWILSECPFVRLRDFAQLRWPVIQ